MSNENNEHSFWNVFKDGNSFVGILCYILIFILLTAAVLAPIVKWSEISDEGLIITFLGVLATFIVVGNWSQVNDIRNRAKDDIEDHRKDVSTILTQYNEENARQIESLKRELNKKMTQNIKSIISQLNTYKERTRLIEPRILEGIITHLFKNPTMIQLIKKISQRDTGNTYKIVTFKNITIEKAKIEIDSKAQKLVCRDEKAQIIPQDTIISIDGVTDSLDTIYYLFQVCIPLYNNLDETSTFDGMTFGVNEKKGKNNQNMFSKE